MPTTGEPETNIALGEVLRDLRPDSWRVHTEAAGSPLQGGGTPDILIEDAARWPVVIEAEYPPAATVEQEATERLNRKVGEGGLEIETAIALIYPHRFRQLRGEALRDAIRDSGDLRYALFTHRTNKPPDRLPAAGWLSGGVRDLAMLAHRAAAPTSRVDRLADELECGVSDAADLFTKSNPYGDDGGKALADVIGQSDDANGQTRRMAMTIIANALVFHAALADAHFQIPSDSSDSSDSSNSPSGSERSVRPVGDFRHAASFAPSELRDEWERILQRNYYPIFWSAREMLGTMSTKAAADVLNRLWRTAERLVAGGVTRSHDLTGVVFQRLIADKKFLATFFTGPPSATLLAGLALPIDRVPGGSGWQDAAALAKWQIGDFACGTGTLLAAAYQRISILHELYGGAPRTLHPPMMKNGLVGLDVLSSAVHLTATMLASAHPATPFEGECLLTMPYGKWGEAKREVAIGSLSLLSNVVQDGLIDYAAAKTAGGRRPEEVRDLVNRIEHGKFDLVIMNPPFTRPGGQEGEKIGAGNPAFAAFNTPKAVQKEMTAALRRARGDAPLATGNAGLAADFVDLAMRKLRPDGTLALVLPLSAVSGESWQTVRNELLKRFRSLTVVTIAAAKSHDRSFSQSTGMAECLIIGSGGQRPEARGQRPEARGQRPEATLLYCCAAARRALRQVRLSRSALPISYVANQSAA